MYRLIPSKNGLNNDHVNSWRITTIYSFQLHKISIILLNTPHWVIVITKPVIDSQYCDNLIYSIQTNLINRLQQM